MLQTRKILFGTQVLIDSICEVIVDDLISLFDETSDS
jgi:hypothetical protein